MRCSRSSGLAYARVADEQTGGLTGKCYGLGVGMGVAAVPGSTVRYSRNSGMLSGGYVCMFVFMERRVGVSGRSSGNESSSGIVSGMGEISSGKCSCVLLSALYLHAPQLRTPRLISLPSCTIRLPSPVTGVPAVTDINAQLGAPGWRHDGRRHDRSVDDDV